MPQRRKPNRSTKAKRSAIAKLKKDVSVLKKSVERKCHDVHHDYVGISNGTTNYAIFNDTIPQGDTKQSRSGDKITAKSLLVKYQARIASGVNNDHYNQIRVIIFKYITNTPTAIPSLPDILQYGDTGSSNEARMTSPYKTNSNYRFTILHDKVHNLYWGNSSGAAGGAPRLKSQDLRFDLKNASVRYDVSSNAKTGYMMLMVSDSGAITHPEMCWSARFYFTDE